jgi:hypothetical protein
MAGKKGEIPHHVKIRKFSRHSSDSTIVFLESVRSKETFSLFPVSIDQ